MYAYTLYSCVYIHTHKTLCVYICDYTYLHMYKYLWVCRMCINGCLCIYMYLSMYICMYKYACIHILNYVYFSSWELNLNPGVIFFWSFSRGGRLFCPHASSNSCSTLYSIHINNAWRQAMAPDRNHEKPAFRITQIILRHSQSAMKKMHVLCFLPLNATIPL